MFSNQFRISGPKLYGAIFFLFSSCCFSVFKSTVTSVIQENAAPEMFCGKRNLEVSR